MKKLTPLLLLAASSLTPNFAASNDWESGFYQGIIGYLIDDNDQTELAIGCNWGNDDHLEHSVIIISNGEEAPLKNEDGEIATIEFVINGHDYHFPRETHSAEGAAAWKEFSQALASAHAFELFWDGEYIASFNPKNLDVISNIASCAPMQERASDLEINDYQGPTINLHEQSNEPHQTTTHVNSSQPTTTQQADTQEMATQEIATQKSTAQSGTSTPRKVTLSYSLPRHPQDIEIPVNGFGIDYQTQVMTKIEEVVYLTLISGYQTAITIDAVDLNNGQCPLSRAEKGGLANAQHLPDPIRALYGQAPIFPMTLQPGESTYLIFKDCPKPQNITITTTQEIQEIKLD